MDARVPALISRAEHLCRVIRHLQGDSAIVHESNKYLGALEMHLRDFESDESLRAHIVREQQWSQYSEENAIDSFEFRLERAAIAIENYVNKGQFNCGYWHPLKKE